MTYQPGDRQHHPSWPWAAADNTALPVRGKEGIMNKYEALIELRKIYADPLLDLILKAKLREIIETLEDE